MGTVMFNVWDELKKDEKAVKENTQKRKHGWRSWQKSNDGTIQTAKYLKTPEDGVLP